MITTTANGATIETTSNVTINISHIPVIPMSHDVAHIASWDPQRR